MREPWPKELSEQLKTADRLRRSGRQAEALAQLRALAEAHPRQARVHLELGLTLAVWGQAPQEALPHLDRALALASGLFSARLQRALAYAALGRHAEAVADLDALAAAHYRNVLVLRMKRAESLEALGRLSEAEADWTRALAEDEGNTWLLQQRARVRRALGHLEGAREDLDAAVARQREGEVDPRLHQARAEVRRALGDGAGARADVEAALAALQPADGEALAEALRGLLEALEGS